MIAAVGRELHAFLTAALFTPVQPHPEPAHRRGRRRVVVALTLLIGALTLGAALRIPPGDPWFYLATLALAVVWTVGAFTSGPLHLGRGWTRAGGQGRPVVQALALGLLLLAVFLAGAFLVAQVPVLREPVLRLLDHARLGSVALVLVLTVVNGIAEELFFRGALYEAVGGRGAIAVTTVAYVLVTAAGGIVLLVFAGAVLGLVTALQRRVTGGILAPVITHLTWSVGMLVFLPQVLRVGG